MSVVVTRRGLFGLALVGVAGCTQLPTSGPVTEVTAATQGRGVQFAPEPPAAGMSPASVVEGFLQALADPAGSYQVARQYLTTAAGKQWQPAAATVVYDGQVFEVDGAQVLRGTTRGTLDVTGRFSPGREDLSHDFQVSEEAGEWRIGAPPSGVFISSYIFTRSYATVKSYFMASGRQTVIADLLHVPLVELTPERIVEAQLLGPGDQLATVTHSAIPEGAVLGSAGATVDVDGVVTVDLTGLPNSMNDEGRRALGAQLLWSLSSIPRVTGLRITSDGASWVVPGQNTARILELSSQQGYQPLSRASAVDLLGVRGQAIGRLSPEGNFVPLGDDGKPDDMATMSLDGAFMAHVTAATGEIRIGPAGGGLTSLDSTVRGTSSAQFSRGRLWLLGRDEAGAQHLVSVSSQGDLARTEVNALPGEVVDFAVDTSGTRVGLLVKNGDTTTLGIAMIDEAYRLAGWQPLAPVAETGTPLSGIVSLDWTSELDLALLATGDAGRSVFVVRLDGSSVSDIGPANGEPVQITALPRPGGDSVAIRYPDGDILIYSAHRAWQAANATFDWISYPG